MGNQPKNIKLNLKYSKNSQENLDNFIFIKSFSSLRNAPNYKSENTGSLKYSDKPELLFELTSNIGLSEEIWYYVKNQKKDNVTEGFLNSTKGIKRGFYWTKIGDKINLINSFIENANMQKKDLYTISAYVPLSNNYYTPVDKFGNRASQSIKGYINSNLEGEYINLPDQTLFKKLSETKDYI